MKIIIIILVFFGLLNINSTAQEIKNISRGVNIIKIQNIKNGKQIFVSKGSKIKFKGDNIKIKERITNISTDSVFTETNSIALNDIKTITIINTNYENLTPIVPGLALGSTIIVALMGSTFEAFAIIGVPFIVSGVSYFALTQIMKNNKYKIKNNTIEIVKIQEQ